MRAVSGLRGSLPMFEDKVSGRPGLRPQRLNVDSRGQTGARKEVKSRVGGERAKRAGRRDVGVKAVLVCAQEGRVTCAQLGEERALGAREEPFFRMDWRRPALKDRVRGEGSDVCFDEGCMGSLEQVSVFSLVDV